jgi:hypothetical protein
MRRDPDITPSKPLGQIEVPPATRQSVNIRSRIGSFMVNDRAGCLERTLLNLSRPNGEQVAEFVTQMTLDAAKIAAGLIESVIVNFSLLFLDWRAEWLTGQNDEADCVWICVGVRRTGFPAGCRS